jgi:hypothetical protein
MHEKYGSDGLVVLGVLLDDPTDDRLRADGLKYLGKVKPPFENVYLDAPPEVWQKKLRLTGYPGVYVFNRDNHHVKKLPVLDDKGEEKEEVDYDVVEKVVANLMKK